MPQMTAKRAGLAAHILNSKAGLDPEKVELLRISWRNLERSTPPLDLLTRVGERYPLKSFELTSENGR
jgi:hypothetical protein